MLLILGFQIQQFALARLDFSEFFPQVLGVLVDGAATVQGVSKLTDKFDQIAVGDTVAVLYSEALELRLLKGQQAPVELTDSMGGARAEQGEKPAGAIGREVRVVGNVIAVDAATQTITLQGPERTVELALQDPEQFKLVEVGDQVEATYVQLLALAVEPQP
jgi:hypothetical protein